MKTVGEMLKKTRKKKGHSLLEVSEELKIQTKFLKALENSDYGSFGHPLHIKGFLKNYADFLGLNVEEVLAFWRREYREASEDPEISDVTKPLKEPKVILTPKKLFIIVTVVFVVGFLGYIFWQFRSIAGPPELTVSVPTKDMIVSEAQVTLRGGADPQATLTINGQEVSVNDAGEFTFDYVLSDGPNELVFKAQNEFGKETVVKRNLIYDAPRVVVPPPREASPSAGMEEATPSADRD